MRPKKHKKKRKAKKSKVSKNIPVKNKTEPRWDPIFIGLMLLMVAIFAFFYIYPKYQRIHKQDSLAGETYGQVISVKSLEGISHGQNGSTPITTAYIITFQYKVDDRIYTNQNRLPSRSDILYHANGAITVKYNPYNPDESYIQLK